MRSSKTKFVWFVTILTLVYFGVGGFVFGQEKLSGGPYVQTPTLNASSIPDPTTLDMVWYTDSPCPTSPKNNNLCTPTCQIQYRQVVPTLGNWITVSCSTTNANGTVTVKAKVQPCNCLGSIPCLQTRYELSINGLTPGNIYEYILDGNGGVQLEPCPDKPCDPNKCSTSFISSCTMPSFEAIKDNTTTRTTAMEFFAFGDSGTYPNDTQKTMATAILNLCPGVDFGLHVGDIIYPGACGGMNQPPCPANATACNGSSQSSWSAGECAGYPPMYFQPYHNVIRDVPFFTTLGNQDVDFYCPGGLCCAGSDWCSPNPTFLCPKGCVGGSAPPYLSTFSLPPNGPNPTTTNANMNTQNYYFDYGNARFITINSTITGLDLIGDPKNPSRPNIVSWLDSVLNDVNRNHPGYWKFIFFHHQPYGTGAHGSNWTQAGRVYMRPDIVPTIERYASPPTPGGNGLDGRDTFVFSGHDHDFELFILDNNQNPISRGMLSML